MALNYAVVEFDTDNSIDVVNINEIVDCCDIFLKEGTVVKVCYKKKGSGAGSTVYSGKIVSFHGEYQKLINS